MHGIWNGRLSPKIFVVKRRTRQPAPARGIRISQTPILPAHPYLRYLVCLCISVLLLACCSSRRLNAQTSMQVPATFDFQRDREPIISLNGVWRFHPGDDPDGKLGWAKPDFDDSSWPLLRSNTGWGEQGYKGYRGFAWYRFKVLLPDEHGPW